VGTVDLFGGEFRQTDSQLQFITEKLAETGKQEQ
jgi:hypothetical protein